MALVTSVKRVIGILEHVGDLLDLAVHYRP